MGGGWGGVGVRAPRGGGMVWRRNKRGSAAGAASYEHAGGAACFPCIKLFCGFFLLTRDFSGGSSVKFIPSADVMTLVVMVLHGKEFM